jgi:transcriptional regulator with XRE-family HTH domain
MPRSVRLREDVIGAVQRRINNEYYSQNDLANELGFAQSTISNFANGKPVDRCKFQNICEKLGFEDWRSLAESPSKHQNTAETEIFSRTVAPAISIIDSTSNSMIEISRFPLEAP